MFSFKSFAIFAAAAIVGVSAESHTISFTNKCGYGTPTLIAQSGAVLSTGGSYTSNGPITGAIAYLQTGGCGYDGTSCTLLETTLNNDVSSTDISLISPHTFSVTTGFGYYNGCDGVGADCTSANCPTTDAFHSPTDYSAQRQCTSANVDLAITFCD